MFDEDDLLPISALSQLAYCERRCALLYLEGQWEDNRFTVEGHLLHDRSHEPEVEMRGGVRTCRGLRLRSLRLGLSGQADVVEFHRVGEDADGTNPVPTDHAPSAVALQGLPGLWQPFPVEYKRGRPKPDHCDVVQLCAQALCLEEMLEVHVPAGALYYGQPHRRLDVTLTQDLRNETEALAQRLHELVRVGVTPPASYDKRCRNCSLLDLCLPQSAGSRRSAAHYLSAAIAQATSEEA